MWKPRKIERELQLELGDTKRERGNFAACRDYALAITYFDGHLGTSSFQAPNVVVVAAAPELLYHRKWYRRGAAGGSERVDFQENTLRCLPFLFRQADLFLDS